MWFNAYVMHRREEELWLLDGDIMVNGMNAFGTQVASYQVGKLHHFDYRQCKEQYARQAFFEPDFETFRSDWQEEKWRVSGPVLGWNQLLAPAHSPARELDDALIEISKFMPRGSEISQYYNLYGFRRALRIYPQQLEWEWDNGDLLLRFELPTGAYASVFLASVLQEIDPLGCISNSLIIPLPK